MDNAERLSEVVVCGRCPLRREVFPTAGDISEILMRYLDPCQGQMESFTDAAFEILDLFERTIESQAVLRSDL